jgi:predicted unusual protein kinase regulating ubiquinone biosynthesis (AarF/ABC1/UbiB family)
MKNSRYRHILWFFFRMIVSFIFWDILIPHIGLGRVARNNRSKRLRNISHAFRIEAIKMGGVMIKVGQFLSARLDVLPQEITDELSGLQDEVLPEDFEDIRKEIETEFSTSLAGLFVDFDPQAVASASIGQVHRAHIYSRLPGQPEGEKQITPVVVKVQRPHIEEIVNIDLAALRVVSGWIYRYPPIHKRANVPGLLEEFSNSLYEEIDYIHEGKNAEKFAENFKDQPEVHVPFVYWSHTARHTLTLEDVHSIKITDYEAIEAAGINRAEVANRLVNTYLKQIFEDHFFHADPHPGNLFVHPTEGENEDGNRNWNLVFVDFGMTGTLSSSIQVGLKEMLIGIGTQDPSRVVKSFQELGILIPGADLRLIEKATGRMFKTFWGKTTPEMMEIHQEEAEKFVNEFRDLLYEMPFQFPENMILLGRCVSILSGMCSGLNPEFNFWTNLVPYTQKLVQGEGKSAWRIVLDEVLANLQSLVFLPKKTESLINLIEQGKLEVSVPEIQYRLARIERKQNKVVEAVLFSAFLIGSIQVYLAGQFTIAGILGAAAAITFLILILKR